MFTPPLSPVEDTAEVIEARANFLAAFNAEAARTKRSAQVVTFLVLPITLSTRCCTRSMRMPRAPTRAPPPLQHPTTEPLLLLTPLHQLLEDFSPLSSSIQAMPSLTGSSETYPVVQKL